MNWAAVTDIYIYIYLLSYIYIYIHIYIRSAGDNACIYHDTVALKESVAKLTFIIFWTQSLSAVDWMIFISFVLLNVLVDFQFVRVINGFSKFSSWIKLLVHSILPFGSFDQDLSSIFVTF